MEALKTTGDHRDISLRPMDVSFLHLMPVKWLSRWDHLTHDTPTTLSPSWHSPHCQTFKNIVHQDQSIHHLELPAKDSDNQWKAVRRNKGSLGASIVPRFDCTVEAKNTLIDSSRALALSANNLQESFTAPYHFTMVSTFSPSTLSSAGMSTTLEEVADIFHGSPQT